MLQMNLQLFAHKKGVGSTKNGRCLLYTSLTAIGVFPLIAADVILLLALAVLGIWELDHMPER